MSSLLLDFVVCYCVTRYSARRRIPVRQGTQTRLSILAGPARHRSSGKVVETPASSAMETAAPETEAAPSSPPAASPHPLWSRWQVWEHRRPEKNGSYADSMSPVANFGTVEEFWRIWRTLPSPSKLFLACPAAADRHVDSLSLFLDGVRPEWEDEANATGCELFCRRPFAPAQLDRLWHALVLGVVGGSLGGAAEHVTGVRVVNKSSGQRVMYRVELWLRTESCEEIKAALPAVLLAGLDEDAEVGAASPQPASPEPRASGEAREAASPAAEAGLPSPLAHILGAFRRRVTERDLPNWE